MAKEKLDPLEQFNQEALDAGMSYGKWQVKETCRLLRRNEIQKDHIETPDERVWRLYQNVKMVGVYK